MLLKIKIIIKTNAPHIAQIHWLPKKISVWLCLAVVRNKYFQMTQYLLNS